MYRLIMERYITWSDLKTMTIDDIERLNIAADAWADAKRRAQKDPP